jgi:hypothetical protein
MSGSECTPVWLLRGVDGAMWERQPWGTGAGRWVAWGGMRCERCTGWRGVCDSVLLSWGALGNLGGVDVGCRGKVLRAPCQWDSVQVQRGRAGWCGVRSTACCVQRAAWHHVEWGSSTGAAGARGAGATGEEGLRRVVAPGQAGVVGARWAVPGGQRLSWAAKARAAGGTWAITAH